jgi:pyridoxal phosphate enzyme (YggS family)
VSEPGSIAAGLSSVRARIADSAHAAGRDPADVKLIAVSKLQPASAIREAYAAGQRDFGENYVQELLAKAAELALLRDLRWHMIGHLQRNKARHVVGISQLVHTVDSAELGSELERRFIGARSSDALQLGVLVEVSIAAETQKHGVAPAELGALLEALEALPALSLRGLMCVPPLTDDPRSALAFFEALAALREQHGGRARLPELSMGMTHDLEQAVTAGATLVRVGSAIFGPRPGRL